MPEAAHLFAFTLVKAVNVGRTGLTKTRGEPLRAVARACLFDRQHHRFLGCSHSIPADLRQCGHFWAFDPQAAAAVVRCGGVQAGVAGSTHALQPEHVSVLVELNVTYRWVCSQRGHASSLGCLDACLTAASICSPALMPCLHMPWVAQQPANQRLCPSAMQADH